MRSGARTLRADVRAADREARDDAAEEPGAPEKPTRLPASVFLFPPSSLLLQGFQVSHHIQRLPDPHHLEAIVVRR